MKTSKPRFISGACAYCGEHFKRLKVLTKGHGVCESCLEKIKAKPPPPKKKKKGPVH